MNKIVPVIKKWSLILISIFAFIWVFVFNYSFVFKRKVVGEAVAVERVMGAMAILTNTQSPINPQAFSFSVAVKDRHSGEIHMASSEDRKWAAVTKGNCVIAAFFPYAPWRLLDKGMSDHNARLLRNFTNCDDMPKQDSFFDSIKFFFLID